MRKTGTPGHGKVFELSNFEKKQNLMEAKELRIGNFLRHISSGKIAQLDYIVPEKKLVDPDWFGDYWGDCEPITLTEEWLKKLSLEPLHPPYQSTDNNQTPETKYYHFYQAWFKLRVNLDSIFLVYDFDWTIMNVSELKYVHQLQNLYFALAGKELEIKE